MTEPAANPLRDSSEGDLVALRQFLLLLGSALTSAGAAVNDIERRLLHVAAAYGARDARITVLPTFVVVALEPGHTSTIESTRLLRGALRLDQSATLFDLLKRAERAEVSVTEGAREVERIAATRPRFGPVTTVLGHVVLTVGICMVLQPTWGDLGLAAIFGAMVGVLKLIGQRWVSVQMIMPVLAAFAVAAITFEIANQGWADADLRAMIAPLITFLPGAMLTMAVVELAAGEIVTGSSRLVSGSMQLLLLAFGIVAAAEVVGIPATEALVDNPENLLGGWAPWAGVLIFGVGAYFHFSAPRGTLHWLLLVLICAWVGQYAGSQAFGGTLSGFTGGLAMTLVAYWVEERPTGPPALVTFLPGFWLLVPGALGLIGITEYLGSDKVIGSETFVATVGAMISIALGVLCGYPLFQSMIASADRLRVMSREA